MPRTLLLRVYIDANSVYGGYYSLLHEECCPTLLPIKETSPLREIPLHLNAVELVDECVGNSTSTFYPKEWVIDRKLPVHNGPRPGLGFYTGHHAPRGRMPKSIRRRDHTPSMAELTSYPKNL